VHAIEPVPELLGRLSTIARRRRNVDVHGVAVSDHNGVTSLHVPVYRGKRLDALATLETVSSVSSVSIEVPVTTLDDILSCARDRVSLVKCDVEGHEQQVLDGAAELLRLGTAAFLVEIEHRHRDQPVTTTFDFFTDLGYEAFYLGGEGLVELAAFDLERDQATSSRT
jgi:FkbM family methyltransferase